MNGVGARGNRSFAFGMRRGVLSLLSCAVAALLAACSPPQQISASGRGAYEASLAAYADGLVVAWYDTRDGNAEIYARALRADGRIAGSELRITTTPTQSYEADIAPFGDAFAIAWYEKDSAAALRAHLGVWARDGTPRWTTPIAVGAGNSRNPLVRTFGDALFCAWIEADADGAQSVWGGWWGRDGRQHGPPVRLGAASEKTWNLNAAIAASGDAWVVYDAPGSHDVEELFLATLAGGRATLTQLSADDGLASTYPDLALEGELGAITWFDERDGNREVYLAVAPAAELRGLIEPRARRVTNSLGASIGAYLAWNRDQLGLAWSDDSGGNYDVYFQPFDARGEPLTPSRPVTETVANSMIPAIEPWRDGFALAWDEVVPSTQRLHDEDTQAEVMFTSVLP